MSVQPYLFFSNGRCEEALNFYAEALNGRIEFLTRFKDAPEQPSSEDCATVSPEHVMHANLRILDTQIMASDGARPEDRFGGFSLSIAAATPEDARRYYDALVVGGQATMPVQETFWAFAFGMLVDRFGVSWMVNCPRPG